MPKNTKHLCFTFPAESGIPKYDPSVMNYMVFGFEIGKKGYPHYQGYLELKKEMSYKDLQEIIGGPARFAQRRGTKLQAINYCQKDGNFIEYGQTVTQGQRTELDQRRVDIENGKSMLEIAKEDFGQWCRNYKAFSLYASMCEKHEQRECEIEVIYGKPGTGKSTLAMNRYPNAYRKSLDHFYWDGYTGQKEVIIDEFRKGLLPANVLLSLVSPAPYQLNIKGSTTWCKATKILIVSNYHPKDWYPECDEVTRAAIQRRIKKITHATTQYVSLGTWPTEEVV